MANSMNSGSAVWARAIVVALGFALIGTAVSVAFHRPALPFLYVSLLLAVAWFSSTRRSGGRDDSDDRGGGPRGIGTPVLLPVRVHEPSEDEIRGAWLEETRRRRRGI